MPPTAETVDNNTGKKAAIKIITMAGISPIPNQRTMKGIQAIGEIGLKSCTIGLIYWNTPLNQPSKSPNNTATMMALI